MLQAGTSAPPIALAEDPPEPEPLSRHHKEDTDRDHCLKSQHLSPSAISNVTHRSWTSRGLGKHLQEQHMLHSTLPLNASAEDGLQVCRHLPFHDIAAVLCAPAALLLAQRCLHCGAAQEGFTLLHVAGQLFPQKPKCQQSASIM